MEQIMNELAWIGVFGFLIMLYLGCKILGWLIGTLNTKPSANWNERLRSHAGPWG
jgi:hypothetical protein